ncbi:MAG: hypothetical protein OEP45_14370 [Acidobacteriota bacterium]|nr:hypothetical protein [Acidobacteriota bacterium]
MRDRHWSVALAALSVGFVLWCAAQRGSLETVWGDEGTYLAMAESLARDGDLRFTAADAARLPAGARGTVILQRTESGVAYSKPVLYALVAAPAVLVLGDLGPVLVNALCLLLAAWLGWRYLARLGDPARAALTVVTFAGASVLLAYVGWRMSDPLQAALSLAGLVLALAVLRPAADGARSRLDGALAAAAGGALLGLLVACRLNNALVLFAAVAALAVGGRTRRALGVFAAAASAFALLALVSHLLIGTANPYKAVRTSFSAETGYPAGGDGAILERFEEEGRTQQMGLRPTWRARVSGYSALYFFVGRHSGVLWYFPALLALGWAAARRPDRVTACLWLGAAAAAAFFLIWWPANYFGGASFLGNRYFLPVYPLALVGLPALPGRAGLALAWAVALVMGGSAVASFPHAPAAAASQTHTLAGLPRRLPYESTALDIEGRIDRYWADDMVRFDDGRGRVGPDVFTLEAGAPPTELMIVSREGELPILLRYRTRTPGLALVVEDRRGELRYPLEGAGKVLRGALTVPLAPAWRRHPFWWDADETYAARTVRLSLAGGTGGTAGGARATFWYGGARAALEKSFEYTGPGLALPKRARAGATTRLAVRVRNMSPVPWRRGGAFPVTLSYRLAAAGDAPGAVVEGPRIPLPADLPSGDPVDLVLPVTWPAAPGVYVLSVDLVIEDYAWFETRVGRPLAGGEVRVVAGPKAAP